MQVYILNSQYDIIGMIDEAESVLWNKKYNDAGYCEIYIPCDADLLSLLACGNYVFRYDDDMFCKIEAPEIETNVERGNYIIAPANDIASVLLSGRIVRWQIAYSGTVAGFIKKVLNDNIINPAQARRRISNFIIDESNFSEFSDKIEVSAFTDDLFALIKSTCKTYNYGFRVSYDISAHQFVFRLYKGKNKALAGGDEYVEFSPTFSNIVSSKYKEDESNYKNLAYVAYTAKDGTVHLLSVYEGMDDGLPEPTGEARKEVFVDASSKKRETTLEELQAFVAPQSLEKWQKVIEDAETDKLYYSSEYHAVGYAEAVATSLREVPEEDNVAVSDVWYLVDVEDLETEKITWSEDIFLLLIRNEGNRKLSEHKRTQKFEGEIDTINTYAYKVDYDIGDIVKVKNEYGIEADARIVEVMESDDSEDGHTVEPVFEYIS